MLRTLIATAAAAAVTLSPAVAQKRSAKDAAKAFTLDPTALSQQPDAAVTPPSVAPDAAATAPTDPAANAPIITRLGPAASLDTPIEQLIADPRAKAVLDADMPGLTTDENLVRFQKLSLKRFQPLTGGQMTPALLAKVGADLAALDESATTTLAPTVPTRKGPQTRHEDGR